MRLAHAGRGFRPDETKELLVHLLAGPGPHCLMLRLTARDVERALGPVLIECLSGRVRLAIEVPSGEPAPVANAINALAAKLGRRRPRVGTIEGNDLLATQVGASLLGLPCDPPPPPESTLVAASVRFGAAPLLALFAKGAEAIVSGPLAPSATAIAFARHCHRWPETDYARIAAAAAAGRILAAGAGAVGGDLFDPAIDAMREIGLPLVEIAEDGLATFESTRDPPPVAGLALALLDGLEDPRHVAGPDVTLDLDDATLIGPRLSGVRGSAPPLRLPGNLTFEIGFVGEGELAYGGTGAAGRAIAAARILETRLQTLPPDCRARVEIVGIDSATRGAGARAADLAVVPGKDVRLRLAVRGPARADVEAALAEFAGLATFGPAGAGGVRQSAHPERRVSTTVVPHALAGPRTSLLEADT
ncbi:MAG: DUF1446 domain-containing protein [Tagaea sp.]|nr:DUF1446 domain-containing protein [Tagaea sp.]